MTEVGLLKLAHTIGFAYWLGMDLGVFYTSYFVANPKLSAEVRETTAKILFALDQGPRICMTLMLPLGLHLGWRYGIFKFDAVVVGTIWAACIGWLAMVITLHVAAQSPGKALLTRFDFWFRAALAATLISIGVLAMTSGRMPMPYWMSWKLLIYGGLVGCGLIIRIKLRDFGPAMVRLMRGDAADADNATIAQSLAGTRPFVVLIWVGLIVSTALGLHAI